MSAGAAPGSPSPAQRAGLARIRARRMLLLWVLGALPVALLVLYAAPWARSTRELVLLGWVALYALATLRVVFSRCPRCGGLFHNVLGFANPLARECRGCRLPLDG